MINNPNKMSTTPKPFPNSVDMDSFFPLFKLCAVLALRGGSLLVQLGTFPTDNVYNIIFQNLIDIAVTMTSFLAIGYPLISNFHKLNNFFGYGTWIGSAEADFNAAINGLSIALFATHIITSLLSGRLNTKASIVIYSIFAGITLPITMQFAWGENSWMLDNETFGSKVSFHDYGGGSVIHCAAGVVGLIGSIFLGRRVLRLKDLSRASLSEDSLGTTWMGYIFIVLGLISNYLPANMNVGHDVSHSMLNCAIVFALTLSILVVSLIVTNDDFDVWSAYEVFQGSIGSLVMLSSGIDQYNLYTCLVITLVNVIVFTLSVKLIDASYLEDYGRIIPAHAINGFIAIIIPKIMSSFAEIHWQLFCAMIIIIFQTVVFTAVFSLLSYFEVLSNENESVNHQRALVLIKSGGHPRACLRIFKPKKDSLKLLPGDDRGVFELKSIKYVGGASSSVSVATNTNEDVDFEDGELHVVIREKKGMKAEHRYETNDAVIIQGRDVDYMEGEEVHKLQDLIDKGKRPYAYEQSV